MALLAFVDFAGGPHGEGTPSGAGGRIGALRVRYGLVPAAPAQLVVRLAPQRPNPSRDCEGAWDTARHDSCTTAYTSYSCQRSMFLRSLTVAAPLGPQSEPRP